MLMDDTFVPFSSCFDHFTPQKEIRSKVLQGCVMNNSRLTVITMNKKLKYGL